MAKAQVTFQGKSSFPIVQLTPLTGLEYLDLQKVAFDWADSYDSKVCIFTLYSHQTHRLMSDNSGLEPSAQHRRPNPHCRLHRHRPQEMGSYAC